MKAIVQERSGPPDVLELVDTDLPEVGPDEVLLQVGVRLLPGRVRRVRDR